MAEEVFGPAFEIHGGGLDLVFPHHENEVAQSRALGHPFAQIWAHNGMLRFTGEKMSKSLGNVATMREALDEWGREALLVFFLGASLAQADRLLGRDAGAGGGAARDAAERVHARAGRATTRRAGQAFAAALDDDFDTPRALAVLHEWASTGQLEPAASAVWRSSGSARSPSASEAPPEVAALAERRAKARADRDFETSDRLRDELAALGWEMRDEPGGGYVLVRRGRDDRPRLRPPGRARGAARAPRRCSRSGRPSGRSRPSRGSPRRSRR